MSLALKNTDRADLLFLVQRIQNRRDEVENNKAHQLRKLRSDARKKLIKYQEKGDNSDTGSESEASSEGEGSDREIYVGIDGSDGSDGTDESDGSYESESN
jgi:hypothetical protein